MKTIILVLAIAAVVSLALPQEVLGQRAGVYSRIYDPNTLETDSGRVVSIEHIERGGRRSYGEHIVLRTRQGRLTVHLGPEWFMEKHGFKIRHGDQITVTGSRVLIGGKPVLIAGKISNQHEVLVLRDGEGMPVWRGAGQE